jgi:hypothetical protein
MVNDVKNREERDLRKIGGYRSGAKDMDSTP